MAEKKRTMGFGYLMSLLPLMNMTCMGVYFSYNSPQLMADQLTSRFENTSLEISYLFTIYSVPNFIGAPLGGYILSRFGVRVGSFIFNLLIFLSSVIIFMGVRYDMFWMIILGRGVYGLGAESIIITQSTIAEKWFTGRFLSFAIGLNSFFNQSTASIQDLFLPIYFTSQRDLDSPFFVIGVISFVSFMVSVVFFFMDNFAEEKMKSIKNYNKIHQIKALSSSKDTEENSLDLNKLDSSMLSTKNSHEKKQPSENDNDNSFYDEDTESVANSEIFQSFLSGKEEVEPVFTFSHIRHLGIMFWLLSLIFVTISQVYYQSINFLTPFLQNRFGYEYEMATRLVMFQQIFAAFAIPILSSIVVVIGMKGFFLIASSLIGLSSFVIFYFMPAEPHMLVVAGVIMLGLQFSLYSCVIWSSLALSVPKQATGIALALATTLQNILMTTMPVLFGYINRDQEVESYQKSILIFITLASAALILSVFTTIYDICHDGILYKSENKKEVLDLRERRSTEWRTSVFIGQFQKEMKKQEKLEESINSNK